MNQITLVKEWFLKKQIKMFKKKFFIIVFMLSFNVAAKEQERVYDYFIDLGEFSSSFLQVNNNETSEGFLNIQNNRIRIDYIIPNKIRFVFTENRGMYYNIELEEVEYFNPKETLGELIINLFNNKNFLLNFDKYNGKGFFYFEKNLIIDEVLTNVKVYFEDNPLKLRKIQINNEVGLTDFIIINHDYNPTFKKKYFSLANPLLSNIN